MNNVINMDKLQRRRDKEELELLKETQNFYKDSALFAVMGRIKYLEKLLK